MQLSKPKLSFMQIINMNVGFFGIQYSFGLQQSAVNPIYDFLGAKPDEIPLLNLAGPMTGLLIQPIIGVLSDRTWHPRFGRRKPYFFIGALFCSLCLFLYPFSTSLWMAAGLLWVLDAANNTAMEPYRAFIADKLPAPQLATGFLTQSFFTGLGITLANISLFFFQKYIPGQHGAIPYWVFGSFFLGSICSISSVMWSISKTPEIPPTPEELAVLRAQKKGILQPFIEIGEAIVHMPAVMWKLALVYLFQWYALFCYWQNASKSIAQSVWKTSPSENKTLYEEAVGWAGLVNGWYNVVTFLSAFGLVWMAKKFSPKKVHIVCLLMAGIALLAFPQIENKYLLFVPMAGFGIAWASMMGIPYLMVVNDIPKEKYGVYMGIINMMIVIPMILQTTTFGWVLNNFLGNDSGKAISFAGVLLLLACAATLLIKDVKPEEEIQAVSVGGH
ncbi:MFS transporter [Sediminibacterium sp.]|jgi:maltose/moltooligosaccharide transporter|uniref:MFS transporter n=3 Tax=Sediminibacterium sp. TaxID=1917865 RepID=UPI000BC3CA14|nr:MFS transporter [Sediminibacterium sp.]OYY11766.1 MAG: MFS transporter [Sphingobacteriia bacterium 35-36-14]OYZ53338.1 MAG: MFS transporter [Sphingobacteriia bacterium 24-36-13]OZA64046.1 MAG: MFS transporter [Sphingobacteriia bacterium 39-36-14]MBP7345000.1 MFS transporter [Sediminibacterium sp.]MDO9156512.1 MFS transporter [Sediminibacterium sp.]